MWPTNQDTKLEEFDAKELPGQQLAASNAFTPLDYLMNLDIKAPAGCLRLTCILACIGKSSQNIETMEKMIASGMNIAVLNMSFGTKEEHIETIKMLRQAVKNYSTKMGRHYPLAIALQLCGRKIRTGKIAEMYGDTVELRTDETLRLTTDETYKDRCSMYTVYVDYLNFATQMKKKNFVLLDNESILLQVDVISASTITCTILRGGYLGSYKDVFIPNVVFDMPNISDKDKVDINMGVRLQVDILIVSFVNFAPCVDEVKKMLGDRCRKMSVIANIQTMEGYRNFDQILESANGILLTRQELGTDVCPKKLVVAQKNIIARANAANKPVFVSAALLSSMRNNRLPLRAELLDIANCILDGADGLMFSAETAVGCFPVEVIQTMNQTCKEAEACVWSKQAFSDFVDKTPLPCDQVTGVAIGAVIAAHRTLAAAIVVITTTGKTAQIVSKYKPRCPVLAVTRYGPMARQLNMWRGVLPLHYEGNPDPDWQTDIEKRVAFATKWSLERGFIRIGDPVVILSAWQQGCSFTNTMRIVYASESIEIQ